MQAWDLGADRVTVLVFRQGRVERWVVEGELPCAPYELVRAVAGTGEAPDAVATVRVDLFDDDGTLLPAVRTLAECGGQRIQRILAMTFAQVDDPTPSELRLFGVGPEPVGRDGWIRPPTGLEAAAAEA